MAIEVKEIQTKDELKKFVKFQLELYKKCPYFVPPLIKDEIKSLDSTENPTFEDAVPHFFLAYQDRKIVGRIAAIINRYEVDQLNIKKLRFGWFDVIDDLEVSRALFAKVENFAKENGLDFIEGPMGASNLDKAGMLTEGFDKMGTVIGIYNYDYYPHHLQQLGFVKEKEWVENFLTAPQTLPEKFYDFSRIVMERYGLKLIRFKNAKQMQPYFKPVFELIDESYQELETFVPITEKQKIFYANKYAKILSPDFINFIEDEHGELCAFAITMPSYAKALQKAKGKLLPWGWYHLWQAQKKNDTVEFVLIGVHPKYQKKGVTAIIFKEMYETFKRHNIKFLETNPELVENQSVQALWTDYNPVLHKRRNTFKKLVR